MQILISFLICASFMFASVGYISAMNGDISLIRDSKPQKPYAGFLLENGDKLETKSDARVQLIFDDETVITLGKNSSFTIDEVDFASRDQKAKFSVTKGTFKAMTGKIAKTNPKSFELKGKTSTIGIRGTHFQGNISDQGDTIACTDGKIVVTSLSTSDQVLVNAGEFTTVVQNAAPTTPRNYTAGDLNKLEDGEEDKSNREEVEADQEPTADQGSIAETIADQVRDSAEVARGNRFVLYDWSMFYDREFFLSFMNGEFYSDWNMEITSHSVLPSVSSDITWGRFSYTDNYDFWGFDDEFGSVADSKHGSYFAGFQKLGNPEFVDYYFYPNKDIEIMDRTYINDATAFQFPKEFVGKVAGGVFSFGADGYRDLGEIRTQSSLFSLTIDPNISEMQGRIKFTTTGGSSWDVSFTTEKESFYMHNPLYSNWNDGLSTIKGADKDSYISGEFYGKLDPQGTGGEVEPTSIAGGFDLYRQKGSNYETASGIFVAK